MNSNFKKKLLVLPLSATMAFGLVTATHAANVSLGVSATDVSEVTTPMTDLMVSIWRTVLAPLLGLSIVFAAIVALYHFIKGFLGRKKKPKS